MFSLSGVNRAGLKQVDWLEPFCQKRRLNLCQPLSHVLCACERVGMWGRVSLCLCVCVHPSYTGRGMNMQRRPSLTVYTYPLGTLRHATSGSKCMYHCWLMRSQHVGYITILYQCTCFDLDHLLWFARGGFLKLKQLLNRVARLDTSTLPTQLG